MGKIEWTDRQLSWLEKHFINTKNEVIVEELCKRGPSLSLSSMIRMARQMGLRKSKQFVRKFNRAALDKMRAFNESTGYIHSSNGAKEQWRKYREKGFIPRSCFKTVQSNLDRKGPRSESERIRKSVESRRKTIDRERRRIDLGLEQKTNLILIRHFNRREIYLRSKSRKKGYTVFRSDESVYYTKSTDRDPRFEMTLSKEGIVVTPLCMRGKKLIEDSTIFISAGTMTE